MSLGEHAPGYPPEPWDLVGDGHLSSWRVSAPDLPRLPGGVAPVLVRGTAVALTAFVDYSPAGLMAYHELLAAVLVRRGRGVALTITDIWVDSETSMAGARALWGIPKDLAGFDGLRADLAGAPIASASFRPRRLPSLPVPVPLPATVVQTRGGETLATRIRAAGRVRPARARWTFDAAGPLGWLATARPLTSVVAEDVRLRFGS